MKFAPIFLNESQIDLFLPRSVIYLSFQYKNPRFFSSSQFLFVVIPKVSLMGILPRLRRW